MPDMKRLIFYAIIPALIAGLFSIAPKLYDIVSAPNAELTYAITKGPELSLGNQSRRIVSVKITNSGKKPVHTIKADLSLPSGEFESFRVQGSTGLRPDVKSSRTAISVDIATLHLGEGIMIAAMELVPDLNVAFQFSLRSDEVLGKQETEPEPKKRSPDATGAILSGTSVFFMALLLPLMISRLGRPKREDIVFYVLVRSGLTEISDKIKFSKDVLTYMRTADILLDIGLRDPDAAETRSKALKALKCFLLVGGMAPKSAKAVEQSIQKLAGTSYSPDEVARIKNHAVSAFRASKIREVIDKYFDDPNALLSSKA